MLVYPHCLTGKKHADNKMGVGHIPDACISLH